MLFPDARMFLRVLRNSLPTIRIRSEKSRNVCGLSNPCTISLSMQSCTFLFISCKEEVKEYSEKVIRKQSNLAKSILEKSITPILDEVVGRQELSLYKDYLEGYDLLFVTLNPPFHIVVERDNERSEEEKFDTKSNPLPNPKQWWEHLKQLILTVSDKGLWVDNSKMTIEETVSYILQNKEKCLVK